MSSELLLHKALDVVHHMGDIEPPWDEVLHSASRLLGTDGAVLINHQDGHVEVRQVGADPAAVADYTQHFHELDPLLLPGMTAPIGTWLDTQALLSTAERERSTYYTDFMCKHHMRQLGTVLLARESPQRWSSLGTQCEVANGRLSEWVRGPIVSRYLSALNQQIEKRRRRAEQRILFAESLFGGLGEITLLVSPSGYVIHVDSTAESNLESAGILLKGRLWHMNEGIRRKFTAALIRARSEEAQVFVPPDNGAKSLILDFVQADPAFRVLSEDLIFVRAKFLPAFSSITPGNMLEAFPITKAEAIVLAALARGDSPKHCASRNGTSVNTVRKQIASLFQKLHCSRQADLVQKALVALGRR